MSLENKEIGELLAESMKKLESTSNQDSKLISDMNNALNWILTLTMVLFVFYTRQDFPTSDYVGGVLAFFSKSFFVVLVILLVFHKVILVKYESTKAVFLETLKTHFIELKFSIDKWKGKFDFSEQVNVVGFINAFRDGKLIEHPNHDERPQKFTEFDRKLKVYGNLLKFSFWTGVVTFSLYFLDAVILLILK